MIKAGHSGGNVVVSGIMHTGIANMLTWQRIKEERGVRATNLYDVKVYIIMNLMVLICYCICYYFCL